MLNFTKYVRVEICTAFPNVNPVPSLPVRGVHTHFTYTLLSPTTLPCREVTYVYDMYALMMR